MVKLEVKEESGYFSQSVGNRDHLYYFVGRRYSADRSSFETDTLAAFFYFSTDS